MNEIERHRKAGRSLADSRHGVVSREQLGTATPIHPVTAPVALRAGQIDGESQA